MSDAELKAWQSTGSNSATAQQANSPTVGLITERLSLPAPEFLAGAEDRDRVEWTVDQLLVEQAVAFFAGEPKSLKSWASLDVAIAVGAGVPAFGRFAPAGTGSVLIVQEESRWTDYARRLRWLARGHGLAPSDLEDVHVSSQPGILLDDVDGQARLVREIERLRPRLVVLDPLVRMHSADEDRAREMRPVFRFVRRLQAEHDCGVLLIHHMSKAREGVRARPGQRLRGTGDFHALLDSALYFEARPGVQSVAVAVEHREAPPPEPFTLRLEENADEGEARLVAEPGTLADLAVLEALPEVESALEAHPEGLTKKDVEEIVSKRAQVVRYALTRLKEAGRATEEESRREDAAGRQRKVMLWKRRSA
jgi:hypothetical protein